MTTKEIWNKKTARVYGKICFEDGERKGKAEALAEVKKIIKELRKKSDRCSDCDGCNCDLCMLEFVKLKQLEQKK